MGEKLRVGIIGAGKMGELHLQKYVLLPNVELTGIFEPDQNRGMAVGRQYGLRVFPSLQELFFECDAVSITSPTHTHFLNCRQALEAGVHVLVEKPMCDDVEQATELVAIAKRQKLVLQVGYLERFRLSRLSRLVPSKTVKIIEARWFATQLPRERGLDVVSDMLVHPLDLILSLCHEEPEEVRASGFTFISGSFDVFEARLEFPSGLVGKIMVNRVAQHKERRVTLFSSHTMATLNFLTDHIEYVRKLDGNTERVNMDSEGTEVDVLRSQITDFVKCVRQQETPLVSAEDGIRVLKTIKRLRDAVEGLPETHLEQRALGELYVT